MGFVQLDTTKTKELDVAPEGEYEVTCINMDTEGVSKKGEPQIPAAFKIAEPGYEDTDIIRDWFGLPSPRDEENDQAKGFSKGTTRERKVRKLKRMLYAFGVPFSPDGFDGEDIVGETTKMKVFVRQEPVTDKDGKETGQMANRINWPRFQNEEPDEKGGKRTSGARRR